MREKFTFWHGLLVLESMALLIALATTIVPGRTGSTSGIAAWFFTRPGFYEKFLVNLVGIHLVLALIALVVAAWWWKSGAARSSGRR